MDPVLEKIDESIKHLGFTFKEHYYVKELGGIAGYICGNERIDVNFTSSLGGYGVRSPNEVLLKLLGYELKDREVAFSPHSKNLIIVHDAESIDFVTKKMFQNF